MELQQIIVIAVVFFCVILVGIRIYQYFKRVENNQNPCAGCNSDCSLKTLHAKEKHDCKKTQK